MPILPTLPPLPAAPTRENLADWMIDVEAFRGDLADAVAGVLDTCADAALLAKGLNDLFAGALANRSEPLTARVLASGNVELTNEASGYGVVFVREAQHWWLAPHPSGEYARPSDAAGLHGVAADFATGFEWWADPAQMQVMAGALSGTKPAKTAARRQPDPPPTAPPALCRLWGGV